MACLWADAASNALALVDPHHAWLEDPAPSAAPPPSEGILYPSTSGRPQQQPKGQYLPAKRDVVPDSPSSTLPGITKADKANDGVEADVQFATREIITQQDLRKEAALARAAAMVGSCSAESAPTATTDKVLHQLLAQGAMLVQLTCVPTAPEDASHQLDLSRFVV